MHVEAVGLREIDDHSAVGGHGITCHIVVVTVVGGEHILVDTVNIYHMSVSSALSCLVIMEHAIADHRASLVAENRTTIHPRLFGGCVVVAVFGVDTTVTRHYIRRAYGMCF